MSMMPFKMGVLAMPMMGITPAERLQSVSDMFSGDDADANTDGNATEQNDHEFDERADDEYDAIGWRLLGDGEHDRFGAATRFGNGCVPSDNE